MVLSDDGRYRLGEELGKGALATVVAVTGPAEESYAGKLLHDSQSQDPSAVARFLQEAALLRSLDHPNLVRVIETATVGGRPMLVMERVDGPTLAQEIARNAPLSESRILSLGRGIASGLAHAHAAGVIHRDLKPGNVLLQIYDLGPHAKIADFGMARASSLAGVDHQAMTVVGTPDYMAPESIDPLAVDLRSDLYALGCILYEMATGRPPFDAATPLGLLHQHRSAPIPALPDELSPGLRRLIERLLAKSPGDRPQAAEAIIERIDLLAGGDETRALAVTTDADGSASIAAKGPSRCTACDQPLLPELNLCLACGQAIASLGRGDYKVIVTGPGSVPDKLDLKLRNQICAWIEGNPGLHLDAAPLAKTIPRLPFTLCAGVDQLGSEAVVRGLAQLGVTAVSHTGSSMRIPAMRQKATTLAKRIGAIIAVSCVGTMQSAGIHMLWVVPLMALVVGGANAWSGAKPATKALARGTSKTPAAITAALKTVEEVVPALHARRHRLALRAVVHRAFALLEGRHGAAAPEELAQAIAAATVAAGRLDALDRELERRDIREASDSIRDSLHERDVWSARLLELTASLDAIQARASAALHKRELAADDDRLGELRDRIEALEEIAALEVG